MHRHRASSLKQSNKSHKTNKASKRSLNKRAGGKVQKAQKNVKSTTTANGVSKAKANRKLMAKQRREASRDKLLQLRRSQGRSAVASSASVANVSFNGSSTVTPRLVGIVSLSEREEDLETSVTKFLVGTSDESNGSVPESSSVSAKYSKFKREGHVTYLPNSCAFRSLYVGNCDEEDASIQASLDLCRVCDMVIFLLDGSDADKSSRMNSDDDITGMDIGDAGASVQTRTVNTSKTSNTQFDYDHLISSRGDRILSAIKAQGLPTPMTVLVNKEGDTNGEDDTMSLTSCSSLKSIRRSALKRRLELKKYVSRFATTEFGENVCKVMELDLPAESNEDDTMQEDSHNASEKNVLTVGKSKKVLPPSLVTTSHDVHPTRAALLRTICTTSASPPKWVADMPRAYILSESNSSSQGYQYDSSTKELHITGFVRGRVPWNVNSLVHLPNVGTFGVKRIQKGVPPFFASRKPKNGSEAAVTMNESDNKVEYDPEKREPLNMFADADALEGEQNLIGFEDDNHFDYEEKDDNDGEFNKGFARPAGWNDYQSAWLDAIQDNDGDEGAVDHGELAFDLNKKKSSADTVATEMYMDEMDANDVTEKERKVLLQQRQKDQEDEAQFPDEVEVKEDEKARERFARYRSLKSFRKSYWDPKENLPTSYATIFHFDSFRATQADVMADMKDLIKAASSSTAFVRSSDDENMVDNDEDTYESEILEGCVLSGTYVTITVENVSQTAYNRVSPASLLTAVSLLPHENKVSVLHMGLSQTTQCDEQQPDDLPVKSKDVLTFRCGWRTWQSKPIFSQNNLNSDKHKFERYLPTGGAFFAASVLGPVTYAPTPVMVFRQGQKTQLVALGTMLNADADRIVVKRIVLTGFPTRVHKRHATVKYMFFTPEDVKWFKPAELTTKHGLQGNILQSVGDHGTMKCLFNAPIKQHDTVCLTLYKRVYPKYAPSEIAEAETGCVTKHDILVL